MSSFMKKAKSGALGIGAVAIAAALAFGSSVDSPITDVVKDFLPSTDSGSFSAQSTESDQFLTHDGKAVIEYDVKPGEIVYEGVDNYGRAQAVYSSLTTEIRAEAKERGRGGNPEDTNADPAGWGHNEKVTIEYPSGGTYTGWFWNRSHLLADSLGGKAAADAWVTGTRTQNVGRNDGKGGMAYTETIARKFLDDPNNANCPLYYAAVPNYKGSELVPRNVTVDIQSCDKSIDERVTVNNMMPGYEINYMDGSFREGQ